MIKRMARLWAPGIVATRGGIKTRHRPAPPARESMASDWARPVLLALSLGLGLLLLIILCKLAPQAAPGRGGALVPEGRALTAYDLRGVESLPAPEECGICAGEATTLCIGIYTGTVRSTFTLINPGGISGFRELELVNFDQRVVGRSPTTLDIEVTTRLWVDTQAPYPVDGSALPPDIQSYLLPEPSIQSDHPDIVAEAQRLVAGASLQAEAVDAIQAWVRGNITYDYTFSLPNDALSVYHNRSGVCAGFSTLSTALLRAAGIPARYHRGCVSKWGWGVGDAGGWHAWVEIYYPDVGWLAADPQTTANYVDTSHILYGFDQCGSSGTVITRTGHLDNAEMLDGLRTEYIDSPWGLLRSASIPIWPRRSLSVSPAQVTAMVSSDDPLHAQALWIQNSHCWLEGWLVRTEAPWLAPEVQTGLEDGPAWLTMDATGMEPGQYSSPITVSGSSYDWYWSGVPSQTITATLWVVDTIHECYLPMVSR